MNTNAGCPNVRTLMVTLLVVLTLALPRPSAAQPAEGGLVTPVSGQVSFRMGENATYQPLVEGRDLPPDASVRTGDDGFALIQYADSTEIVVRPGSEVLVGGRGRQGIRVMLGKVLIRVRRLFRSGQEREHATPTTVAAVRGTEFGLGVDDDGTTGVYVFEGVVAVRNPAVAGSEIQVPAGRMTRVGLGLPPTSPRPFDASEFEGSVGGGGLERGEDRLVEGAQAPVAIRYLAVPDPDVDAQRNPAYLVDGPAARFGSFAMATGLRSTSSVERDGTRTTAVEDRGAGFVTQHIAVIQPSRRLRVGFGATWDRGYDRSVRDVRPPGVSVFERTRQRTEWNAREGRALLGVDRGVWSFGIGGAFRRSDIDTRDRPFDLGGPATLGSSRNDVTTFSVGGTRATGAGRIGLVYHHESIESVTDRGGQHVVLEAGNDVLEALIRGGDAVRWAGWLRTERTDGAETRTRGSDLVYVENRTVWTTRAGFGSVFSPTPRLLLTLDAAVGLSSETANQSDAAGTIEDEDDLRFSGSVHMGSQASLTPSLRFDLSILHRFERIDRTFDFPRGDGGAFLVKDDRTGYSTVARGGFLYVKPSVTVGYHLSSTAEPGRPPTHTVFVSLRGS